MRLSMGMLQAQAEGKLELHERAPSMAELRRMASLMACRAVYGEVGLPKRVLKLED